MKNREKRRGKKGMENRVIYPIRMLLGFVRIMENRRKSIREKKTRKEGNGKMKLKLNKF